MMFVFQSQYDTGRREPFTPKLRMWAACGLLLLLVALLVRSWDTLSRQSFFVEDALLFNLYYGNHRALGDVTVNHFGQPYITLISNFFAWVYAHLDVRLQALFYQWTGFVFGVTAAVCLFFSGLIRSRTILLLGPLLMGLTAFNHIYYYNTLIYVMYTAVALLLALMFFPAPKRITSIVLLVALGAILPWAGPYSVVGVPAALALLLLFKQAGSKRLFLFGVLVSTILYYLTVEGNTTRLVHLKKWGVIKHYFQVLLEQVVFLGQVPQVPSWVWLPVLLGIAASFYLLRDDTRYIKNSLIFFGIIVASLALFFLSIKFPLYLHTSACHRYLSVYFWCFFLLYTADRYFVTFGCPRSVSAVFALCLLVVVIHDNLIYPRKRKIEVIEATNTFLQAVHQLELLGLEMKNQVVVLKLDNYQTPFFEPRAVIGSRAEDAERLEAADLPPDYRNPFIINELKQ